MTTPEDEPRQRVTIDVDALLPQEIALKAESSGAHKARMPILALLTLSVLAGSFISIGALFALNLTVPWGAESQGLARLVGGLAFSLAFVLVVVGGAELFTSNVLMVMALVSRKIRLVELLRAWIVVYVGNLLGTVGTAAIAVLAGQAARDQGAIGEKAIRIASDMAELGTLETFFRGVLGNVLVCLAAWISYSGRSTTDRILAVVPPVVAFYAMGLEHVIATMFYFPLGFMVSWVQGGATPLMTDAGIPVFSAFFLHLAPVTVGNIVGGGVLVGAVYWFVYLRPRHRHEWI